MKITCEDYMRSSFEQAEGQSELQRLMLQKSLLSRICGKTTRRGSDFVKQQRGTQGAIEQKHEEAQ